MIYWIVGAVWVVFGILAWGFYHGAHKAADYSWCDPRPSHFLVMSLSGPAGFLAVATADGLRHWAWKPITRQERWESHQKKYAVLGRTYENFDKVD